MTRHCGFKARSSPPTVAAIILSTAPHDPVGLYFQGLLAVQHPNPTVKRQGLEALRASVSAGIEPHAAGPEPALSPTVRAIDGWTEHG